MAGDVRQYDFSGGELAPLLRHRSDLKAYGKGLRTCRNFVPTRHGSLLSRPGTEFVRQVGIGARMLRFTLSDDESWLVEVRQGKLRFHRNKKTLLNTGSLSLGAYDGTERESDAPWTTEFQRLRYAQSGLTLTLTHQLKDPQELKQTSASPADFALTPVSFALPSYGVWMADQQLWLQGGQEPMLVAPLPSSSASKPARPWIYKVSAVYMRPDGTLYESEAVQITRLAHFGAAQKWAYDRAPPALTNNRLVIYPDLPCELHFGREPPGIWSLPDTLVATRIYRGRGNLFGLVGEVLGDQQLSAADGFAEEPAGVGVGGSEAGTRGRGRFVDDGGDPDYATPPPAGTNPFQVFEPGPGGEKTLLRTERPNAVAYFDGRLVFGGTQQRGNWLWFSAVNDYRDFDERMIPVDAAAVTVEIATTERQEIRSLLPLERLLLFTDFGVWVMGESPISGVGINALRRVNGAPGASWLEPVVTPGGLFYVTRQGNQVRNLSYSLEGGGYASGDTSFFSQHLFEGKTVVAWAYAENPWGVLWVVLSDGTLLSLTYAPDLGIAGWARHDTQGWVRDVQVVPEGDEDVVYLVVERQVPFAPSYWCLERMATRVIDEPEDAICLDCATVFPNGTSGAGPFTSLSGLAHLAGLGRDVWAVADGNVVGPLQVASDGTLALPFEAAKVVIGFRYICEAETLDVPAERLANKRVVRALIDVERSRHFEIGVDENTLEEWSPRAVADGVSAVPLFTGPVSRFLRGGWAETGRVLIRQSQPMPLTITGITREIEGGSR